MFASKVKLVRANQFALYQFLHARKHHRDDADILAKKFSTLSCTRDDADEKLPKGYIADQSPCERCKHKCKFVCAYCNTETNCWRGAAIHIKLTPDCRYILICETCMYVSDL